MRKLLPIILIVTALAAGTYLGYRRDGTRPVIAGPALVVTFLDASFGGGVVAKTPEGQVLLVDPGPEQTAGALIDYLRSTGTRKLAVVVSNPSSHRCGALESVIDALLVTTIYRAEWKTGSQRWRSAIDAARERGIPEAALSGGSTISLSKSVALQAISPPNGLLDDAQETSDNNSLVVRISYRDKRFVLMSDVGVAAEAAMLRSGVDLRSDVVGVARGGQYGATSLEILRALRPEMCVLSVGDEHPSTDVMERLDTTRTGAELYRTDTDGSISMVTDGRSIVVSTSGAGRG